MANLLSLTDIYNKFAFEWTFGRDIITWQSPVQLLLGDLHFYETGDHFANRMSSADLDKRLSTIHQAAMKRVPYTVNYDLQVQGDKIAKIQEQGRIFFNPEGQMLLCRGYIRSQTVTEAEAKKQKQPEVIKQLAKFLGPGEQKGIRAAFVYFSIDRIPLIGIRFGMEEVNNIINQVEELLKRMVRTYDIVGRVSGTSFGIILQNCDHNEIIVVAKRLVEVLEHTPFMMQGQRILISASIGGCVIQQSQSVTVKNILDHSERALLDAQHIKKVSISPAMAAKQLAASSASDTRKRRGEDIQSAVTNE